MQISDSQFLGQIFAGNFVNSIPKKNVVGFPQSSWFTKFAKRPKKRPGGVLTAIISPIGKIDILFLMQ